MEIQKLFVPLELAVKLKYLSFDEYVFGFHLENKTMHIGLESSVAMLTAFSNTTYIKAPTWDQAFNWMREVHNLDSFIFPYGYLGYAFNVDRKEYFSNEGYSYEQARELCLISLIKIVENGKQAKDLFK